MRLNLGCGPVCRKGFLNADAFDRTVADILCNLTNLPFKDEAFEYIEGVHVIEHLGYVRALYALSECRRILKPRCRLVLETPDIEASFRTFLRDRSIRTRSWLLTWIFGLDSPGQAHAMLYPARLLKSMLEQAGFRSVRIGKPRTHLYREGMRVGAVRSEDGNAHVVSRLRHKVLGRGIVDLDSHLQALEFERLFIKNVNDFHRCPARGRKLVFQNLVYSPDSTLAWLEAVRETGGADRLRKFNELMDLCVVLVDLSLASRLTRSFYRYIESPQRPGDAYAVVFSRAVKTIRGLACRSRRQAAAALRRAFPERGGRDIRIFSRCRLESEIGNMRDRGVKQMIQGRHGHAARLLRLSVNSGLDGFYAVANYAVLSACSGRLGRALRLYEAALACGAGEAVDSIVRQEMVKCRLHRRRRKAAWKAAGDIKDRGLRSFWRGVVLYHGGELGRSRRIFRRLQRTGFSHELLPLYLEAAEAGSGRPLALPGLRTEPLVFGEGAFHDLFME